HSLHAFTSLGTASPGRFVICSAAVSSFPGIDGRKPSRITNEKYPSPFNRSYLSYVPASSIQSTRYVPLGSGTSTRLPDSTPLFLGARSAMLAYYYSTSSRGDRRQLNKAGSAALLAVEELEDLE